MPTPLVFSLPILHDLQRRTGTVFGNPRLIEQAFIHRSFLNEFREQGQEHNERLEFLGDAVLELVVTEYLYRSFPKKTEGELTKLRAALVNITILAELAINLGLNDFLLLSRGEAKDNGRARQTILGNTFEALIGAIYLDRGRRAVEDFLSKHLFPRLERVMAKGEQLDPKSHYQELAQGKFKITPAYKIIKESGPDHQKNFTVALLLNGDVVAEGCGWSKQEAEASAAKVALKKQFGVTCDI